MSYSRCFNDTVELSSDLSQPLWLVELVPDCVKFFYPEQGISVCPIFIYMRRSYRKGHRTRYLTIPNTRQSFQDKPQKISRLKTQAWLIWTECLRPQILHCLLYIVCCALCVVHHKLYLLCIVNCGFYTMCSELDNVHPKFYTLPCTLSAGCSLFTYNPFLIKIAKMFFFFFHLINTQSI